MPRHAASSVRDMPRPILDTRRHTRDKDMPRHGDSTSRDTIRMPRHDGRHDSKYPLGWSCSWRNGIAYGFLERIGTAWRACGGAGPTSARAPSQCRFCLRGRTIANFRA
eukprot:180349-Prymnesium_polylepis.1